MFYETELMHASPYSADEQTSFLSGRCHNDLQEALSALVLMPDNQIWASYKSAIQAEILPKTTLTIQTQ